MEGLKETVESLTAHQDPERLLTSQEAADRLQISIRKLSTLCASGEIPVVRIGRSVRFHPDALDAFVRRKARGAGR